MTVQGCILFLSCAFYLAYFAESSLLGFKGKLIAWSLSLTLGFVPIMALLIEFFRRVIR